MMLRAVCVLALVAGCALRIEAQPSQPELVERASAYVTRFLTAFSNVVAEEHYEQEATVPPRRRTLRSDVLLVRYPGTSAWQVFRDVLEVDGRMVRGGHDGRLAALFRGPADQALARAQEIAAAGARHNIHDIGTLNNPLLVLAFLQRGNRERFRFTLTTGEPSLGPTVRTVQFEEVRVPTLLRLGGNLNMPARGLVWIDETDGRVVRTELRVGQRDVARSSMTWRPPSTITTTFGLDETLGIDVPLDMRDHYALEHVEVHGVATYSRFRRFPVGPTDALTLPASQPPAYDEPLRPRFHFTPARYFMNDPNGLVFYKGEYHLFYQHNPFGETWGHMSWGHAVSPDMLHWQHLPVALREEQGVMIFSGSVVVDWHNSSGFCEPRENDRSCLVAVYTGHGPGRQTQNLAYSNDRGRTWTKYAKNPVIDLGLKDFRDPKTFWHEPTRRWIMVTVLPDQHKVRLFASPDLKSWTPSSDFGPAGATGGVWECPDLFELPIEGEPGQTRWVLDVDINPGGIAGGSAGQYFVGTFDGTRFVADDPPDRTRWADYGKDFYASLSFSDVPASDGRRIWMAWISNWQYANVEPSATWRGAQSVPRALMLRRGPDGLRLVQAPVAELEALRTTPQPMAISGSTSLPPSAEIILEVSPGDWQEAGVRLSNSAGEEVIVGIARTPLEVFVDRRKSRRTAFHAEYPGRHAGPVAWRNGTITLRILFDRSVLEVFANDGETVVTDRVFPTKPLDRLELLPQAEPRPAARMWTLGSVWERP